MSLRLFYRNTSIFAATCSNIPRVATSTFIRNLSAVGYQAQPHTPRVPSRLQPIQGLQPRHFSSTPRAQATEDQDSQWHALVESFRNSPAMEKLANSPDALQALKEMINVMKTAGLDMTSKPSMMTMMKMYARTDVREAAQKVVEEFQKAGVEFNPKTAMDIFKNQMPDSKK